MRWSDAVVTSDPYILLTIVLSPKANVDDTFGIEEEADELEDVELEELELDELELEVLEE